MSLTPVCVKCGREMWCEKNDFLVYHMIEKAGDVPVQETIGNAAFVNVDKLLEGQWKEGDVDFIILGDKYRCPTCGYEIVKGFGQMVTAVQWNQESMKERIAKTTDKVEIRRGVR